MVPPRQEGRFAIVTDAGRDAVDAGSAFDEWRWRGRRSRVVLTPRRWRQVCGDCRRRWWQKSPVTKESTKETVKTIARGMPGVSGVTVVTTLVCSFYFACEAAGALSARHSLRPLFRANDLYNSDALRRGKGGRLSRRHREERSDEAIHSSLWRDGLLRFACNDDLKTSGP